MEDDSINFQKPQPQNDQNEQKNQINQKDEKEEKNQINQINQINQNNQINHINQINQINQKEEKNQINQINKINQINQINQKDEKEKKANQETQETQDIQYNPAPAASLSNLNLNLKKSDIDFSKLFFCIKGDITTVACDVIVNSSSPNMLPIMGVSKSIHNKCGSGLLKYLKSNYNGILQGGIVDSPNFGLKCKKIIHAVGPYQNNDLVRDLENIYDQCLHYCFSHKYYSIAFPNISTGGSKFNEERAAWIAINTCKSWIERFGIYWKGKVFFVCFTDRNFEAYKKYFQDILGIS